MPRLGTDEAAKLISMALKMRSPPPTLFDTCLLYLGFAAMACVMLLIARVYVGFTYYSWVTWFDDWIRWMHPDACFYVITPESAAHFEYAYDDVTKAPHYSATIGKVTFPTIPDTKLHMDITALSTFRTLMPINGTFSLERDAVLRTGSGGNSRWTEAFIQNRYHDGIVFVADVSTSKQITIAKAVLHDTLQKPFMAGVPILLYVLANHTPLYVKEDAVRDLDLAITQKHHAMRLFIHRDGVMQDTDKEMKLSLAWLHRMALARIVDPREPFTSSSMSTHPLHETKAKIV